MWYGSVKVMALALLWCGLCAAAPANTTAGTQGQLAQNAPAEPLVPNQLTPLPVVTRMALLLPLRSPTLGAAAGAVRAGVLAAHEREPTGVTLTVLESGEAASELLPSYAAAVERFDLVIGPLSRADVTAVAQSGNVSRPTIALAQPQPQPRTPGQGGMEELPLPPRMLVVGLSLEDEARQVADWIGTVEPMGMVFVISSGIAWQERAARAFALQAQAIGLRSQSMELSLVSGALSPSGLVQLQQRITAERPQALFVAFNASQARQLRAAIGDEVPLYGTSQLNPLTPDGWATAEPANEMNGTRLVDIPWQLQPDHPAVMVYPHPLVGAGEKRSADLERLYALGIDAYRVAREVAAGNTNFGIDGVTGKLSVSFGAGSAGFQRSETQGVYRDGKVWPLAAP